MGVAALSLIFLLANVLVPFNQGIFWDDWVWFENQHVIQAAANEMGQPLVGAIYAFFSGLPFGVPLYKTLVAVAFYLSGLLVFRILRKRSWGSPVAFWAVALAFVWPLNIARATISVGHYMFFLLAFIAASALVLEKAGRGRQVVAALLFFLSFHMNSLLFFYSVPIAMLFFKQSSTVNSPAVLRFARQNFILLLVPFLFWMWKRALYTPFGAYDEYNQISLFSALFNLKAWIAALTDSLVTPLEFILGGLWTGKDLRRAVFAVGAIAIGVYSLRRKRELIPSLGYLVLVLLAGLFPYLAVGKTPVFGSWDSRHQILLIFPVALMIVQLGRVFTSNEKYRARGYAALLVLALLAQWRLQIDFQGHWQKAMALVETFKSDQTIASGTTFEFADLAEKSPPGIAFSFFDYSGIFRRAFGDTKRFGGDRNALTRYLLNETEFEKIVRPRASRFNLGDYVRENPQYKVVIKATDQFTRGTVLQLMVLEWTNPEQFKKQVGGLVKLEISPWGS